MSYRGWRTGGNCPNTEFRVFCDYILKMQGITKTKSFSKSKVSFPLPYLLNLQRETWNDFWKIRLKELFSEISPILDYTGKELELWFLDYKFGKSNYKDGIEAKKNNDSYEAPLRVKIKLVNLKTKDKIFYLRRLS